MNKNVISTSLFIFARVSILSALLSPLSTIDNLKKIQSLYDFFEIWNSSWRELFHIFGINMSIWLHSFVVMIILVLISSNIASIYYSGKTTIHFSIAVCKQTPKLFFAAVLGISGLFFSLLKKLGDTLMKSMGDIRAIHIAIGFTVFLFVPLVLSLAWILFALTMFVIMSPILTSIYYCSIYFPNVFFGTMATYSIIYLTSP